MPVEAFWVRILVERDGVRTGTDHGYATFVDGWFVFEGLRTSFALKESDVSRIEHPRDVPYRLALVDGTRLVVDPLGVPSVAQELKRAVVAWRTSPSAGGESVFPPALVHPQVIADETLRLLMAVGGATVLWLTVFGAAGTQGFWLFFALASGGLFLRVRSLVRLVKLRQIGW